MTKSIIDCSPADYSPNSPSIYNINLSNPYEGQNFIVVNSGITSISLNMTFTDNSATITSGNGKFFYYLNGKWNYYVTNDYGGGQYSIRNYDNNISPVAILNRRSNDQVS